MRKGCLALLFLLLCPQAQARLDNPLVFSGEVVRGCTSTTLNSDSSGKIACGLPITSIAPITVNGTTTTTSTASPSTAVITSMTITPVAGNYEVKFCSTFQSNANNIDVLYGVFAGGSAITGSEMSVTPQIQGGLTPSLNQRLPGCTVAVATVNGSQAIEIRWHVSAAGTATAGNRTLIVTRIP